MDKHFLAFSKKPLFLLLSLAAGLSLFGMILILSLQRTQTNKSVPTITTPPLTSNENNQNPFPALKKVPFIVEPQEQWKTYTDLERGFSFKYPSILEFEKQASAIQLIYNGPTQKYGTEFYDGLSIAIVWNLNDNNLTAKEWVDLNEKHYTKPLIYQRSTITINGIQVEKVYSCGLGCDTTYYIPSSSRMLILTVITGGDKENQYKELFDQILSTFQFLNESKTSQVVNPEDVDINSLIPNSMNYEKSLYLDFDGDGQKEIVLIGTDKEHTAGQQAGPSTGFPLIQVFKINSANQWQKAAEVNYTNFPTNTNLSILSNLTIISLNNSQGLVLTYYISGSRTNEGFIAVVSNGQRVNIYNFPQKEYESFGGKSPHTVEVNIDGTVKTKEGIYTGTDANCCPSGGTLEGNFQITQNGIKILNVEKKNHNLTF